MEKSLPSQDAAKPTGPKASAEAPLAGPELSARCPEINRCSDLIWKCLQRPLSRGHRWLTASPTQSKVSGRRTHITHFRCLGFDVFWHGGWFSLEENVGITPAMEEGEFHLGIAPWDEKRRGQERGQESGRRAWHTDTGPSLGTEVFLFDQDSALVLQAQSEPTQRGSLLAVLIRGLGCDGQGRPATYDCDSASRWKIQGRGFLF